MWFSVKVITHKKSEAETSLFLFYISVCRIGPLVADAESLEPKYLFAQKNGRVAELLFDTE